MLNFVNVYLRLIEDYDFAFLFSLYCFPKKKNLLSVTYIFLRFVEKKNQQTFKCNCHVGCFTFFTSTHNKCNCHKMLYKYNITFFLTTDSFNTWNRHFLKRNTKKSQTKTNKW